MSTSTPTASILLVGKAVPIRLVPSTLVSSAEVGIRGRGGPMGVLAGASGLGVRAPGVGRGTRRFGTD